ncbi:hypothetical protein Tco_1010147, partial [Tanacetum coccineum]
MIITKITTPTIATTTTTKITAITTVTMITTSSKIEGRKPLGLMETMDIMDLIPCVGSVHCITQYLALSAIKVLRATAVSRISCLRPLILLSLHLRFDMENAFSTMNIHNYTSASSATSGSIFFNSLEDSRDGMIPPTFSLFYNNPYLKDMQAYDAIPPPQAIIALPAILPLSSVLSLPPMFYS